MNFTIESKSNSQESRENLNPNPTKQELADLGKKVEDVLNKPTTRRDFFKNVAMTGAKVSVLGKVLNALGPKSAEASESNEDEKIDWKYMLKKKNRHFEKTNKYALQPFDENAYNEALNKEKDPLVVESMKNFARNAHELENLRTQCMDEKNRLEWFKKEAENFAKKLRAYDIKGECAKIAELQKTNPHEYAVKLGELTDELSFQLQTANAFIQKSYAIASGKEVNPSKPASGSTFKEVENFSYKYVSDVNASYAGFFRTIERVKNPPPDANKDRSILIQGADGKYLQFFAKFDTQPAIQELVKEKGVVYEMSRVMRDFYNDVPWKRPDLQELANSAIGINGLTRRLNIYLSTYLCDNPYKLFREDFDWYRSLQEGVSQEYVDLRRLQNKMQRLRKADDFYAGLLKPPPFQSETKKIYREHGASYDKFVVNKYKY